MFKKGDHVIYRSEGVCTVSDIRSESFGAGEAEEYYILTPVGDTKSTIFVPVNNEVLTAHMKPLMNAEQINELVSRLKDERLEWQTDARARNASFKEILSTADRERMVLLMNTLRDRFAALSEAGKKISTAEQSIYLRAERLFYDELSASTDISSQSDVQRVLKCEMTLKNKQ